MFPLGWSPWRSKDLRLAAPGGYNSSRPLGTHICLVRGGENSSPRCRQQGMWVKHTPAAHSRGLSRASSSTLLHPTWPIAQSPDSTHSQSVGPFESWRLRYRQEKEKKRKEPFPYIIVNPAHNTSMLEISHSNYLNQIKIRFQISISQG